MEQAKQQEVAEEDKNTDTIIVKPSLSPFMIILKKLYISCQQTRQGE